MICRREKAPNGWHRPRPEIQSHRATQQVYSGARPHASIWTLAPAGGLAHVSR